MVSYWRWGKFILEHADAAALHGALGRDWWAVNGHALRLPQFAQRAGVIHARNLHSQWQRRHVEIDVMIFWARTDNGRSAISPCLSSVPSQRRSFWKMEGVLIWEALNRVLIEFYEVGGAAVILVPAWATITTFVRERRRTR